MRPSPIINWSIVEKTINTKTTAPWSPEFPPLTWLLISNLPSALSLHVCQFKYWALRRFTADSAGRCVRDTISVLSLNLNRRLLKFKPDGDDQRGISFPPHIKDRCVFDTSALTRQSQESKISDLSWFNLFRCGISAMNIHVERYSSRAFNSWYLITMATVPVEVCFHSETGWEPINIHKLSFAMQL